MISQAMEELNTLLITILSKQFTSENLESLFKVVHSEFTNMYVTSCLEIDENKHV